LGTRAASAFRTKGAVAIGFSIFGTTVLFVNCHLSAHAGKYREREKDLRKIFHGLDLPKELPIRSGRKHKDVTNNYDTVFLFGDLNFRIDKPREQVIDASSRNQIELLLQADELNKCLSQSKRTCSSS
jgi:inositol polyphosphate 5-phosphatase INPP5E